MTAGQGKYCQVFRNCCKDVCYALEKSGLLDRNRVLHSAVVTFSNKEENDNYVTRDGFTGDINAMLSSLNNLPGAPPTGLTSALDSTLKLQWRPNSIKITVVISDAPPHVVGQTSYGNDRHGAYF